MGTLRSDDIVYRKWEKVGQAEAGTLISMEKTRRGGYILKMADDNGEMFRLSAPTLLARTLDDNWNEVQGEYIRIRYVKQDKPTNKGENGVMWFEVDTGEDARK